MKTITSYLKSSAPHYKATMEKNVERMKQLEEESKKMQKEYNALAASNNLINNLLVEIEQLPNEEVKENATENSTQGS